MATMPHEQRHRSGRLQDRKKRTGLRFPAVTCATGQTRSSQAPGRTATPVAPRYTLRGLQLRLFWRLSISTRPQWIAEAIGCKLKGSHVESPFAFDYGSLHSRYRYLSDFYLPPCAARAAADLRRTAT